MILKCQPKTKGDGSKTVKLGHASLLEGHSHKTTCALEGDKILIKTEQLGLGI